MYFVWAGNPILMEWGPMTLRWYSIFFTLPFVVFPPIFQYMYEKAGKDSSEVGKLTSYVIIGVIFGARLGHAIFYEWSYYKSHLLQLFLPVVFYPKFKIVGFSGLASHGAAIGIVLAIFFYTKRVKITNTFPFIAITNKKAPGEFLWILDHLVILVALGGSFIRIGNFMNSEIIGKPTKGNYGVVFVRDVQDILCYEYSDCIESLVIHKARELSKARPNSNYVPIQLDITFKETWNKEKAIEEFLEKYLKKSLVRLSSCKEALIFETYGSPLNYTLSKKEASGIYHASVYTWGVPRHPSQLYESFSCLLIFIILFFWWKNKGHTLATGRMFGMFLVVLFSLRFGYEFYKENQVPFEDAMLFNMGQLLSLPWIVLGLYLIFRKSSKKNIDFEL